MMEIPSAPLPGFPWDGVIRFGPLIISDPGADYNTRLGEKIETIHE
jgi:hypothetical protein